MKHKIHFPITLVMLLLTCICNSPKAKAQNLQNGLKVHYTFETAPDAVVPDVSGNGYDGFLMENAVIGVAENGRNVMSLDGNTAHLEIAQSFLSEFATYTDFSVATWLYINTANDNMRILDIGTGTGNNFAFTTQFYSNGHIQIKIRNDDAGLSSVVEGNTGFPGNEWAHVAFTLEGTVGILYLNGQEIGRNESMNLTPSEIGIDLEDTENTSAAWIGKSQWAFNGDAYLNGDVSDYRIYNRALTQTEVLNAAGFPIELITAYNNLNPEGLDDVTENLVLPESDGSVAIKWTSSDTTIIDSLGNVTPPIKYDVTVLLTASLTMENNGFTYTMTKNFDAFVGAVDPAADLVAEWNFNDEEIDFSDVDAVKVTDLSDNGFTGQLYNDAKIRTIGETNQYNVLDLGNGQGYFDLGTEFGKEIYLLGDYTISAYYLVEEENTDISSNGNFIWCISNTDDIDTDRNGAMIERLTDHRFSITPTIYGADQQTVNPGVNSETTEGWKGTWHHVLYVQSGSTGTVYIDGEQAASGTVSNLPSTTLKKSGREGTLYNWIGRSCYTADVYLKHTLIYDFRLYGVSLTESEIQTSGSFGGIGLDVLNTLDDLNAAYDENKDASYPSELDAELANLELGDLSNLTTNIDLPSQGELDNSISIVWSSTPGLISSDGVVTRPDYLDTDVRLTATLTKRGYKLTKVFNATIPAKEATKYTSDLLIHFSFSEENVDGTTVTDLSEQHFEGQFVNGAYNRIYSFNEEDYGVLMMWNDSAYFDMGDEVGKVIYALKGNFSIITYFLIDPLKPDFSSNGNFLFTFSNSDSSATYRNGYMFGRATTTSFNISPKRWDDGQIGTTGGAEPSLGEWHHYVYTQNDTTGIVYVDGVAIDTAGISMWPNTTIPKAGMLGTMYNFLGRPNFEGDVMLNNAMMYDFQVYNRTLTPEQVSQMNDDVTENLYYAYLSVLPNKEVRATEDYTVDTSIPGMIRILDLKGDENVSVYNLIGRQITVKNVQNISVERGIYIVKVNDSVKKVLVK